MKFVRFWHQQTQVALLPVANEKRVALTFYHWQRMDEFFSCCGCAKRQELWRFHNVLVEWLYCTDIGMSPPIDLQIENLCRENAKQKLLFCMKCKTYTRKDFISFFEPAWKELISVERISPREPCLFGMLKFRASEKRGDIERKK